MKLVTLSSDFGKQTQGVGNMEAVVYSINPVAKVVHLMHGIPGFDVIQAARTMETVYYMPVGFHVCVVDPGVGTKRKGIIIKVKRGDYFAGPDNGCLMTAPRLLGGIEKAVEISNEKYMIKPISPIFHGRHVFAPAAAYLSKGVKMKEFGKEINPKNLAKAPYDEAVVRGGAIEATVIHINHFGSLHLNILHDEWDKLEIENGNRVEMINGRKKIIVPLVDTFGDVAKGEPLIMKDDYQRMEVALNCGSFVKKYPVCVGDKIMIKKKP
ncbi:MAG: SAM-dependent chlorinase/fluorinase [Candidatus Aenigmarchaeota archaeon]|nr:SAM-dependent chlorinase/fluorinase [Candidatus Aenigmarchaeota archaeon]